MFFVGFCVAAKNSRHAKPNYLSTIDLILCNLLDIEDSVGRVHGSLVLGRLTDQTLLVGEGNERWGGEATLLVGNDLDGGALVDSHTRVGGAQIDADGTIVNFVSHVEGVCGGGELGGGWVVDVERKRKKYSERQVKISPGNFWNFFVGNFNARANLGLASLGDPTYFRHKWLHFGFTFAPIFNRFSQSYGVK